MKSLKGLAVVIGVIAAAVVVISTSFVASALAISEQGTKHALTPGSGLCNADQKIHDNAGGIGSPADQGFHGGVAKNFGAPLTTFVGPGSTCGNH
jgi:hypothetical protein